MTTCQLRDAVAQSWGGLLQTVPPLIEAIGGLSNMPHITVADIDPQELAQLRPFPLNPIYLVSPKGRVLRVDGMGWLRPCIMKRGGYYAVCLWEANKGHLWKLNKIVAWTFHGPPPTPKHHAAHHDGIKANNCRENITWKTKIENEADKIAHGTTNRGERNGMVKLTDVECAEIRAKGLGQPRGINRRLAKEYGVSDGAISNILRGKRRIHAA